MAWEARHGLTGKAFQETFDSLVSQGHRLEQYSGYVVDGVDFYAGLWEKSGGPAWQSRRHMTGDEFQAKFDDLVSQGYRLKMVNGYAVGSRALYCAIWDKAPSTEWKARHGMTSDAFQKTFDSLLSQGYRLTHISGYGVGGVAYYAAIWDKSPGPEWQARHGMTSAEFQKTFDSLVSQGYRLKHINGYGVSGVDYYAAIWHKSGGPAWRAHHRMTSSGYQETFDSLISQGYKLKQVSGYEAGAGALYAAIWEKP
jgi:hypothetical protein